MDAYVVTSHSHQAVQYMYNAACKQSLIVHQSMCPSRRHHVHETRVIIYVEIIKCKDGMAEMFKCGNALNHL